jgi:hypothetical protein
MFYPPSFIPHSSDESVIEHHFYTVVRFFSRLLSMLQRTVRLSDIALSFGYSTCILFLICWGGYAIGLTLRNLTKMIFLIEQAPVVPADFWFWIGGILAIAVLWFEVTHRNDQKKMLATMGATLQRLVTNDAVRDSNDAAVKDKIKDINSRVEDLEDNYPVRYPKRHNHG